MEAERSTRQINELPTGTLFMFNADEELSTIQRKDEPTLTQSPFTHATKTETYTCTVAYESHKNLLLGTRCPIAGELLVVPLVDNVLPYSVYELITILTMLGEETVLRYSYYGLPNVTKVYILKHQISECRNFQVSQFRILADPEPGIPNQVRSEGPALKLPQRS